MKKIIDPEPQVAVDYGVAGVALDEERGEPSGDAHVLVGFPGGVLVGVIDGLGHGVEAAVAAKAAARVLKKHAGEPILDLFRLCHEKLRKTRGAVMTVVSFNARDSSLTWTAVGNVDAVLLRANANQREGIAMRGGVVGYQLPPLREVTIAVSPRDTLVMATDGIRSGFLENIDFSRSPQVIADSILAVHGRGSDDALVLVARFGGEPK